MRPAEIERSDLLGLFTQHRDRRVVLVTAPAGYGKSIFAAQWCAADPARPAGWVALSEAHDDPVVLLRDVLSAVPGEVLADPDFNGGVLAASAAAAAPPALLQAALKDLGPFSLVLDDLHRVTNPHSATLIDQMLDALPPGCQTVLVSRTEPAIGISRRRAHGHLLEIGSDQLAMGIAMTREYLAAAGVTMSLDTASELHRNTEGWPAGIGLAALAHAGSKAAGGFAPGPTGTHRTISDYLVDEVLIREDQPMRQFLLQTSILSRFSAELCNAMFGTDSSDEVIRQIERTNLFLIPLDEHRGWFRYHHLFQELLATELDRTEPDARRPLSRAAATWHEAHGTVEEALRYAQDGGDQQLAGRLVLGHWQDYATRGQIETLRAWVSRATDADICSDPALAIGAGWVNMLLGDVERAERYAAAASQHDLDHPSPDGATSVRSALANLRSGLGSGGVNQMLADGLLVQDTERPTRTRWLLGGCRAVGTAHLALGHIDEAIEAFDEALLLTDHRPELRSVRIFCLGFLSLALDDQGDTDRAASTASEAIGLMGDGIVVHTFQALPAHTAQAAALARSGDRPGALAAINETTALLDVTTAAPWMLAELALRNAQAAHEIGETDAARALLVRARRAAARLPDAGTIPDRVEKLARRMQDAQALDQLLSPAERRVHQQLASHRTLSEIADVLYISRSTVKTHVAAIYTKLGVSTRAGAVAQLP